MQIHLKVHSFPEGKVIAICDKDILGKHFEENDSVLDVDTAFYEGKEASKEEICTSLSDCTSATIAGNNAIEIALKCKAISKGGVKELCGIKYALMFRL
ncbi:MAG: DUF424 family protein [Candidatus Aenigmarchaeota archaeon]|nr:DUF424 family protein [Candidatus Aenigmarchaeota archaeon]